MTVLYASTVQVNGVDFWLQAKIGELIVDQRVIPETLVFPFTEIASEKFYAHEWLASVLFYGMLSILGESAMPVITGVLGILLFALSTALGYFRSNRNLAGAVLGGLVAVAVENYRHVLRPELIALLLMVGYWIALDRFQRKPSVVVAGVAVFLVVLWTNVHGSFVIAPALAFLYTVAESAEVWAEKHGFREQPKGAGVKKLLAMLLGVCIAMLVNPYGWDLLVFSLAFGSHGGVSQAVTEWMPTLSTDWSATRGYWLALCAWCGCILALLVHRQHVRVGEFLVFVMFTVLALRAVRFPMYLGVTCVFVTAPYWSRWVKTSAEQIRLHQATVVGALVLLVLCIQFGNAQERGPDTPGFMKLSPAMVEQLRDPAKTGNTLTTMEFGAELIYLAYPRMRPSIDCRIDAYGLDYLAFQQALFSESALLDEFVQRYDVRYILMDASRLTVFQTVSAWGSGKWQIVYKDQGAALLKRTTEGGD